MLNEKRRSTIKKISALVFIILIVALIAVCCAAQRRPTSGGQITESAADTDTSVKHDGSTKDTAADKAADKAEDTADTAPADDVTSADEDTDVPSAEEDGAECTHESVSVSNKVNATCTQGGYSGDVVCTDCGATVTAGEALQATGHVNIQVAGAYAGTCKADGYSGDKVCGDCGTVLEKGASTGLAAHSVVTTNYAVPTTEQNGYSGDKVCRVCGCVTESGVSIPKLEIGEGYAESIVNINGVDYRFAIPTYGSRFLFTLAIANKQYTSPNAGIEGRILELVNVERAKVGAPPLVIEHRADYFTHKRAVECLSSFSHLRPDGQQWSTAYYEDGVYLETAGENIARSTNLYEVYGADYDLAAHFVDLWMKSDAHRAGMLNVDYTTVSVSVVISGGVYVGVLNFYG